MTVERSYAVVGVLEELLLTRKVLENYLPKFFVGFSIEEDTVQKNKGPHKLETSEYTNMGLRKALKEDVEFYEYARQRLHAQA
ncbi:hypothetical protein SK128_024350 [Halocaridina rubra]|uniref:Uncharacterized protein n=1 Tax=Halocaridina rubra TaxID=373956 RepID=A0AAN8WZ07_HALRR